ncbi:hypothetical protein SynPROSU1_01787 [Synechococcus sp. PROS-U-1]|nr:hypothetical protein SynPROSU1_01787 [Synechococcus sp. PROS-U-1]
MARIKGLLSNSPLNGCLMICLAHTRWLKPPKRLLELG